MLLTRENFSDVYEEMKPLLQAHYEEIAWRRDQIPLIVDEPRYAMLNDMGKLFIFTGREAGRLVGYAVFIVDMHLHYATTKFAMNDVFYIHPRLRNKGNATAMLEFCETELRRFDVQVIALHIKPCLDWSPLAEFQGFEPGDKLWLKWVSPLED